MIARESMTNKQSPEYIRVREEIAKELFHQTYQFTLESEVTKNKKNRVWAFHSWDEMGKGNREAWRKFADPILSIKGIAIEADDQELPEIANCGLDNYSIAETNDKCRITQNKMIRDNFKKVV